MMCLLTETDENSGNQWFSLLALVPHLIFSCTLMCSSRGLQINRGWMRSKGKGPSSSGCWISARSPCLCCYLQAHSCFKKRMGEKGALPTLAWQAFSVSHAPMSKGEMEAAFDWALVAMSWTVISWSLMSVGMSGTWEMFNYFLITTLWPIAVANCDDVDCVFQVFWWKQPQQSLCLHPSWP